MESFTLGLENARDILKKEQAKRRALQEKEDRIKNDLEAIDSQFRQRQAEKQEQGERGSMHQQIMKQRFPGVLGRLCDLGSTDKEYDEIISSSCFALENIVVETYEAGQQVVEFLKRNKLGKVTCIILDKIQDCVHYMHKSFQAPNGSVRLFDVIRPDHEKAKIAFYYALRDTLYCKDSNLANKIAYDPSCRRKVVTYAEGNRALRIIDINGTMTSCRVRQGLLHNKGKSKKNDLDETDVLRL